MHKAHRAIFKAHKKGAAPRVRNGPFCYRERSDFIAESTFDATFNVLAGALELLCLAFGF